MRNIAHLGLHSWTGSKQANPALPLFDKWRTLMLGMTIEQHRAAGGAPAVIKYYDEGQKWALGEFSPPRWVNDAYVAALQQGFVPTVNVIIATHDRTQMSDYSARDLRTMRNWAAKVREAFPKALLKLNNLSSQNFQASDQSAFAAEAVCGLEWGKNWVVGDDRGAAELVATLPERVIEWDLRGVRPKMLGCHLYGYGEKAGAPEHIGHTHRSMRAKIGEDFTIQWDEIGLMFPPDGGSLGDMPWLQESPAGAWAGRMCQEIAREGDEAAFFIGPWFFNEAGGLNGAGDQYMRWANGVTEHRVTPYAPPAIERAKRTYGIVNAGQGTIAATAAAWESFRKVGL